MLNHLSPALWLALVLSTAGCTPGAFMVTVPPTSPNSAAAVSNPSTGVDTSTNASAPTAPTAAVAAYASGGNTGGTSNAVMAGPMAPPQSVGSPIASGGPMACASVIARPVNTPVLGTQAVTVTEVANADAGTALPLIVPAVPQRPPTTSTPARPPAGYATPGVASSTPAHPPLMVTPVAVGVATSGPIASQPVAVCQTAPNGGDPGMIAPGPGPIAP